MSDNTMTDKLAIEGSSLAVQVDGQPAIWPKGYSVNVFGGGPPGSTESNCKVFYWHQPGEAEYGIKSYENVGEVWGDDPIEAIARGLILAWDHCYRRNGPISTVSVSEQWHMLMPGPIALDTGGDV